MLHEQVETTKIHQQICKKTTFFFDIVIPSLNNFWCRFCANKISIFSLTTKIQPSISAKKKQRTTKSKPPPVALIKRAERRQWAFKKFKLLSKPQHSQILNIEVPTNPADDPKQIANDPSKWTNHNDETIIHNHVKHHLTSHFAQSKREGTPFQPFSLLVICSIVSCEPPSLRNFHLN